MTKDEGGTKEEDKDDEDVGEEDEEEGEEEDKEDKEDKDDKEELDEEDDKTVSERQHEWVWISAMSEKGRIAWDETARECSQRRKNNRAAVKKREEGWRATDRQTCVVHTRGTATKPYLNAVRERILCLDSIPTADRHTHTIAHHCVCLCLLASHSGAAWRVA